jgi:hypothetical protein
MSLLPKVTCKSPEGFSALGLETGLEKRTFPALFHKNPVPFAKVIWETLKPCLAGWNKCENFIKNFIFPLGLSGSLGCFSVSKSLVSKSSKLHTAKLPKPTSGPQTL